MKQHSNALDFLIVGALALANKKPALAAKLLENAVAQKDFKDTVQYLDDLNTRRLEKAKATQKPTPESATPPAKKAATAKTDAKTATATPAAPAKTEATASSKARKRVETPVTYSSPLAKFLAITAKKNAEAAAAKKAKPEAAATDDEEMMETLDRMVVSSDETVDLEPVSEDTDVLEEDIDTEELPEASADGEGDGESDLDTDMDDAGDLEFSPTEEFAEDSDDIEGLDGLDDLDGIGGDDSGAEEPEMEDLELLDDEDESFEEDVPEEPVAAKAKKPAVAAPQEKKPAAKPVGAKHVELVHSNVSALDRVNLMVRKAAERAAAAKKAASTPGKPAKQSDSK